MSTPTTQRIAPRNLTRLSMPDNYALIEWLKNYAMQPGDTYKSLAVSAARALGNEAINENHVKTRMEEFSIALPTRPANQSVLERLAKLEVLLDVVIKDQVDLCKNLNVDPHPLIAGYLSGN